MKATGMAGKGQGWHKQSLRHSNARKNGVAGGTYARADINSLSISQFNKKDEVREKADKLSKSLDLLNDEQMKWLGNSAQHNDLDIRQTTLLANLMSKRFPDAYFDTYEKWGRRIKQGDAWVSADNETQKVLKESDPEAFPLPIGVQIFKEGWAVKDEEAKMLFENQNLLSDKRYTIEKDREAYDKKKLTGRK